MKKKSNTIFDPSKQYGDYVFYTKGEGRAARVALQKQINSFIPIAHRAGIAWIRQLVYDVEENGKAYMLSKRCALKRGLYSLAWKTIPVKIGDKERVAV